MFEGIIIFVFTFLIGIGCLYAAWFQMRVRRLTKKWLPKQATLIEKKFGPPKAFADSPADCSIYVLYKFEVDAKVYEGNAVFANEVFGANRVGLPKTLNKTMNKISETPTVYYNPTDPNQSFIFHETTPFIYFLIITGVAILFFDLLYGLMLIV